MRRDLLREVAFGQDQLVHEPAAHAFLDVILQDGFYEELVPRCENFYAEVNSLMKRLGFRGRIQGKGARFSFLFGPPAERELRNYQDLLDNSWGLLNRFYGACLDHGIYIHTMMHHGLASAHTDEDVERLLKGIEDALKGLMREGLDASEAPAAPF